MEIHHDWIFCNILTMSHYPIGRDFRGANSRFELPENRETNLT